ncbi:MAG: amidohydrolase family protein [Acidipila sp.]|nr:amidohydrolase family protein [Acidipila sp.]
MKSVNKLTASLLAGLFLLLFAGASTGQTQPSVLAIRGAKIYTLAGAPIEKGNIILRDGRIAAVGADAAIPAGAEIVDGAGLEVYPGLFDSSSQLGLTEIDSVAGTVDNAEMGDFNPQLNAATAIHPASEHIPVSRETGITHTVVMPGGGMIPGQATAIHLAGWTLEEMLVRKSVGLVLNWPQISTRSFDFATFSFKEKPYTDVKREQEKKVQELTDFFDRARHYQQAVEKGSAASYERDLKLEALIPVLKGELPVIVIAERAREIKGASEFCDKQKIRMILAGGTESYKVKDLLRQKNIPVILGPTLALPANEDDPYDRQFTLPAELQAAGIQFAISSQSISFMRRLPEYAGVAQAYGLSHDDALKAVTLNPAQIFGLSKDFGTIETGKIGNLIVTTGDPLEIRTVVRYLFINGRLTSTDNKHRQLYEKYRKRP